MDPVFERICKPLMPDNLRLSRDKQQLYTLSINLTNSVNEYSTYEAKTLIVKVAELIADSANEL